MRKWFKVTNPRSGEAHLIDLDEVRAWSKTKRLIKVFFKNGGAIVIRGKARWLAEAWKELQAETVGVPIYSYWSRRKAT